MKLVIVALALVAAAAAAPAAAPQQAQASAQVQVDAKKVPQIVRSEFDQNPDGGYQFSFESDDGTKREENGELKELKDEDDKPVQVVVVRGQYSYTDSEGKPQTITYYADETGFHAEGDAVPKAPARR